MRRLTFTLVIILALFTTVAQAAQIVKWKASQANLTDMLGNLTSGSLSRVSAKTYTNTSGTLTTSWGDRDQKVPTNAQSDLSQASWVKTRVESGKGADEIVASTSASNVSHYIADADLLTAGETYVFSGKFKAGGVSWLYLRIGAGGYSYFNLTSGSGALGTKDSGVTASISSEDSDGFYRCSIAYTESTAADNNVYIIPAEADGDIYFAGDGTTVSIYGKEIMLEELPSGNVIGSDLFDQEDLGSDLVTNGGFDSDTTGWSAQSSAVLSSVSGGQSGNALRVTEGGSNNPFAQQSANISVDEGDIYKISFYVKSGTETEWSFNLNSSAGYLISDLNNQATGSWVQHTYYFIASATWVNPRLYCITTSGSGLYLDFDTVVLKKVTTPAKGEFTHPAILGSEVNTEQDASSPPGTTEANDASLWCNGDMNTCASEADPHLGTYSVRLVAGDADDADQSDAITVSDNTMYKYSFYYKCDAGTDCVTYSVGETGDTDLYKTATALSATSFTEVSGYFFTDGTDVLIEIIENGASNNADVNIDAVSIRPVQISWVPTGTNTLSIDESNGELDITYVDTDTGAELDFSNANDQSADLTVGDWYLVTFDASYANDDGADPRVEIHSNADAELAGATLTTSDASYELVFKATHATGDHLIFDDMSGSEVVTIDDITIKKIPPLALLEPSTYVNSATVSADPRFSSDGLELGGEATNLLEYSEDFSQWTNSNTTDSANLSGPDGGTNNAYTLTASAANGNLKYTVGPVSGGTNTFSIWMKRVTGTGNIDLTSDDGSTWTTKTLSTSWQRFDIQGTETSPVVGVRIVTDTDAVGIFGAQLEDTNYPMAYIPSDGTQVTSTTEAADGSTGVSWTMSAAVMNAIKDGTIAGTLIVEYKPGFDFSVPSSDVGIVSSKNANVNSLLLAKASTDDFASNDETAVEDADSAQADPASGDDITVVMRWTASGNWKISDNGSGSWVHSSDASNLDANGFAENGYLYLHLNNEYPAAISAIYMYDEYLSDTIIEAEVWSKGGANLMGF